MTLYQRSSQLARSCGAAVVTIATLHFLGYGSTTRADLIITPVFDSSITSDPNATKIESTINNAIQVYETTFSTPINVTIEFQEMTSGLGQSGTYYNTITYTQYLAALTATASTDATDASVLASLKANPINGDTSMDLTFPTLRALGFDGSNGVQVTPPNGVADSIIGLNTSLMNLDRTSINPSKFDLMSIVSHEIDEALGTGSGLNGGNMRPEDLFRYSSPDTRSYTTSSSAKSYLSIDNGTTNLVNFNQTGGGSDYGDWASSSTPRVQDAYGTRGATADLGVEITALDALGYNLTNTSVPEPSSMILFGLGAFLMAALGWTRRNRLVQPTGA